MKSIGCSIFVAFIIITATVQSARHCGPNPSEIYLKRGDKKSVAYWIPPPAARLPDPAEEEELLLQSRNDDDDIPEESVHPSSTLSPTDAPTPASGLTTWRSIDGEDSGPTSEPVVNYKVTDDVTTISADTAAEVNDRDVVTERPEDVTESQPAEEKEETTVGRVAAVESETAIPEEINMGVGSPLEFVEADSKAQLLQDIMEQEGLRPLDPPKTTTPDAVTVDNQELLVTSQSPESATEVPIPVISTGKPSVVEEDVDSVVIEITRRNHSSIDSVSSQLHPDADIAHILMEIPVLTPPEEDRDQPETTTLVLLEMKNELPSESSGVIDTDTEEVDTNPPETPETPTTESPALIISQSSDPVVETDDVKADPVAMDPLDDMFLASGDPFESTTENQPEGSGSSLAKSEPEGSGSEDHLRMPEFHSANDGAEGSGIDSGLIADPVEGSGSIDRNDEIMEVVDEEEKPAEMEFRTDDILINRIRTIVNSLTHPRETLLFRRTSDILQSVFKRTKRSDPVHLEHVIRSPEFNRFLRSQPLPIRRALDANFPGRFSRKMDDNNPSANEDDGDECDLHIKTDPGLHLLLTFHNLSAPYTLDCAGAYVEIEREGNGFEARWCGNPIGKQRGVRSHVIFARSEVRVSVYNNKKALIQHQIDSGNNSLDPVSQSVPTGFSADIEVIDLHDAGQYTTFQRSEAYSNVHRKIG